MTNTFFMLDYSPTLRLREKEKGLYIFSVNQDFSLGHKELGESPRLDAKSRTRRDRMSLMPIY